MPSRVSNESTPKPHRHRIETTLTRAPAGSLNARTVHATNTGVTGDLEEMGSLAIAVTDQETTRGRNGNGLGHSSRGSRCPRGRSGGRVGIHLGGLYQSGRIRTEKQRDRTGDGQRSGRDRIRRGTHLGRRREAGGKKKEKVRRSRGAEGIYTRTGTAPLFRNQ